MDRTLYRDLVNHISIPMVGETLVFPPELEQWRVAIAQYNLTEAISLQDWIPIINHLASALITTPQVWLFGPMRKIHCYQIIRPIQTQY